MTARASRLERLSLSSRTQLSVVLSIDTKSRSEHIVTALASKLNGSCRQHAYKKEYGR